MSLKEMVTHYEKQLILAALATSAGHQRRAAEALGVLPTTLHEKMKRLGIPTATAVIPLEAVEAVEAASPQ